MATTESSYRITITTYRGDASVRVRLSQRLTFQREHRFTVGNGEECADALAAATKEAQAVSAILLTMPRGPYFSGEFVGFVAVTNAGTGETAHVFAF